MKKVPELRFKEFTDEWEEKKLGEIGKVSMCKRILKEQTSQNGEVPFYKIGTFGKKADAFINLNLYKEYVKKYSYPKKGTILISASGTIGRTVKYDGEAAYFQDSNIVWLENDETKLLNQFLYYIYKNINWTTEDTTIARLYNDNLLNVKIMIPIIEEQQKIANFLSAVDEKIEKSEKKVELLKDYKKGMMQKIFAQEIRFKDENGNDYLAWEEKKLGEIFEFHKGEALSKNDIKENGKYKCILYGELFTRYKEIIKKVESKTDKKLESKGKCNDILMPSSDVTSSGLAKACCLQEDNIILSGDMNILRPVYLLNSIFFSYQLNYSKKKLIENVSGTTVKHIYVKDIKNLVYLLPNLEEQQKIADFLSAIDEKIEKEEKKVEELKEFKKGLLQKMFV